jgi:hypothetical protein
MSNFLEILSAVLVTWLVWWLVRRMLQPGAPAEPVDDPFASVPAPRRRGPKDRAGAVALEEPDDDEGNADPFPPRGL